nr:reverse transcriptase domain-containing protein [Tanacetum cinerariifolium]
MSTSRRKFFQKKEEGKSHTPQGRGQEIDKGVQKLLGSPPHAKEPVAELDPHHISVAILQMGDRHSWTFPGRSRSGITHSKICAKSYVSASASLPLRANKSLGKGIKARLDERSKIWLEEISHVLWEHRTMIKSSNGETSFSLTYGTEAVIPVEMGMRTLRTAEVDMIKNNKALAINLDILEEKRE